MNTEQFLEELKTAYGCINKISKALESPEEITGNPDYSYLKDKMEVFRTTTDHVLSQIKTRAIEQKVQIRKSERRETYHKNKK